MKKTDIAIIGLSGRFPKANNPWELWQNLEKGKEGITFFTDDELRKRGVEENLLKKANYVKAAAFIENKEFFDASFFGFTPLEASVLSPQHRLVLECAVEGLENAGYKSSDFEDRIGVYMGAGLNNYFHDNLMANRKDLEKKMGVFMARAYNITDTVPSLVSYKLNLKGPAVNVNTACSTSLVAVHYACQGLLTYECDMALAGGVSLELLENSGYLHESGSVLSPDGHCRSFDAKAAGTVIGGGAGIVVLKRLSEAIEDNDTIYGVIEGSAVNNDGLDKVGFTAPSVSGQAQAILDAQLMADVHPESISYIEAHGAGTIIGDPIEVSALTKAFRANTNRKAYCAIGSVKSSIGHLDVAAGVTGLIKTTLSLKNKKIPPVLHYDKANPDIDFENSPFYVNATLQDWKTNGSPRRAGVSSFGLGGTNAHLIVKEAPLSINESSSRLFQIIKLSAKTETALKTMTANLSLFVENNENLTLADIAYTLHVGREEYKHKRVVICKNKKELIKKLNSQINKPLVLSDDEVLQLYFSFKESNITTLNELHALYNSELVFRNSFDDCLEHIREITEIEGVINYLNNDFDIDNDDFLIPELTKNLIDFSYSLSLAKLWISWGVKPNGIIATGRGLYAAACLTEVFSVKKALLLITKKGNTGTITEFNRPKTNIFLNTIEKQLSDQLVMDPSFWKAYEQKSNESIEEMLDRNQTLSEVITLEMCYGIVESVENKEKSKQIISGKKTSNKLDVCYEMLGELWLKGVQINWKYFYANERCKRIALPTYPFERKYHWISAPKEEEKVDNVIVKDVDVYNKLPIDQWFYKPFWKTKDFMNTDLITDQNILVFCNDRSFDKKLIKKLEAHKNTVFFVKKGKQFQENEQGYTINPNDNKDYDLLWERLKNIEALPNRIIHAWNITSGKRKPLLEILEETQEVSFYSLLYLTQSIGKLLSTNNINLTVLSNNMQAVTDKESLHPEKATLVGVCGTIPKEYHYINCESIDLVMPKSNTKLEASMLDQLYHLIAENSEEKENVFAIRNQKIYVQSYEKHEAEIVKNINTTLKDSGSYLITGGMGSIGLVLGEYIAENFKNTKLILTSRSEFPLKEEWDDWKISFGEKDKISKKITKIMHLEDLGAQVMVLQADVGDKEEMSVVMNHVKEAFGSLNGVIHAAGLIGGGTIQGKKYDNAQKTILAKAKGALILEELLKEEPLDFLMLCSSNSAIFKEVGQVDYSSANAFLDAFAKSSTIKNTISVNWDAWKEVGMAVDVAEKMMKSGRNITQSFIDENLKHGITPKEGQEVFQHILNQDLKQIIISTVDLESRMQGFKSKVNSSKKNTEIASRNQESVAKEHAQPGKVNITSRKEIEQELIKIYEGSLGLTTIKVSDDFFELGGDSLLAVTVLSNINNKFNVDLQTSIIINLPTILEMADYIEKSISITSTSLVYNDEHLSSNMIKIKEGNASSIPLIIIHPVGGDVYVYKDLIKDITDGIPVIGFTAIGLRKGEQPINDVKEMAENYVSNLLKFQPEGPYCLGGSSFGGTVAYEMAQQLKNLGKQIDLLLLIDTPVAKDVPKKLLKDFDILFYLVETLFPTADFSVEDLKKMPAKERLSFIAEKITNLPEGNNIDYSNYIASSTEHLGRILEVFKANILAMWNYDNDLKPYQGDITYFKAKARREKYDPMHPELSWVSLTKGKCDVHVIPGNHLTIHQSPNVQNIAEKINLILKP